MTPEPVKRDFATSDAFMLQFSETMRLGFIDDQGEFVTRDPDFDNPFETDWQSAIVLAESHLSDEAVTAQLMQLTDMVNDQMVRCRHAFQDMKPFVKKAFPNNSAVWKEFGFDAYGKIDKSQLGMVQFMFDVHEVATKYSGILSSSNFTPAMTGELLVRANALKAANSAQEVFKKSIPTLTRNRIVDLNAVWNTYVRPVAETGKLIFRSDYAHYQKYLLPASDEADENINFEGEVLTTANVPLDAVSVAIPALNITVLTDSNGRFALAVLPAGNYLVVFSKPGYMSQNIPAEISEDGTLNITVHLDPAPPMP